MRFMASRGVFTETSPNHFDHTPLSLVLRSDADGSYRSSARMFHRLFPGWDGLDHAIRTGEPGFNKVFGQPLFDYVTAHPDLGPILDAGMTSIHGYETGAMLEAYDFSGVKVLADVGGGNGSLLAGVLPPLSRDAGHFVRPRACRRPRRREPEAGGAFGALSGDRRELLRNGPARRRAPT